MRTKFQSENLIGRPRRRRKDNIKVDIEIECEGVDWIKVAHDRALLFGPIKGWHFLSS
jgi:hypothetical protein